ncbi:sensor histidine kinase [Oceanirhabdus sp. W0125-5]|uniref:sensor histidine kinase n=1 Tax=Oceanirhabdus sp. W0125-5 TaxID=2999116 RepID=UPI0022F2F3A7|nr:HAMP domain-containing sensor histidine kinase [Oceanirhabdus sp. W0125-5]WBW95298.1 HAMP domain-containing sensor histidine kinase [Oceanirhabdus sp. W0125-5]
MSIKYKILINSVLTVLIGVAIMFTLGVISIKLVNNRNDAIVIYLFLFGCIAVITGALAGVILNRKILLSIDELKKISHNIARSELDIEEKSIEEEIIEESDFEDIKESLTELSNEINKDGKCENKNLVLNTVDLNKILYEIGDMFKKRSSEKNIKVQFELCENPLYIKVDSDTIKQVLMNIYHNAVKYSLKDGIINIGIKESSSEKIEIYIKDNGVGINEKELPNIFEDKHLCEECYDLGLGLPYAKKIMKAHGGDIFINSVEGEGTEVILQFKKNLEMKKHAEDVINDCENDNSIEGNNINDDLIEDNDI